MAISAAAVFVLLIVGANIASLLLARQIDRRAETTVRAALGASRGRLLRESLTQSLLLAAAGSLAGVLVAAWLTGPLLALSPMGSDATGNAMREFDTSVRFDGPVLALSVGLTLLIGLGFALLPALRGARADLQSTLRGGGRGATVDTGGRRALSALVISEIAIAVVLLVATGLMIKSFHRVVTEPWGFATDHRLVFDVTFSERLRPEHAARVDYVEQALARIRGLPGVVTATATTPHPMFAARSLAAITPEGSEPPQPRGFFLVYHRMVFPGFFRDAGIPILRGRPIDDTDRPDGPKAAVVSEAFADHFWPGQDPLGKTIKRGRADDGRPPFVVVGVAADTKAVADPADGTISGQWYVSYPQNPNYLAENVTFVVATGVQPESLQAEIRAALARVDPDVAAYDFNTLEQMAADSYVDDRFALMMIGLFGALGLGLSATGIYGLLAFQVARRRREIGVRTAVGARTADIVAMIFRQGAVLLLAGLAIGALVALGVTRLLRGGLHQVSPADPAAYLLSAALLTAATILACWLPARRAARVDPLEALRAD